MCFDRLEWIYSCDSEVYQVHFSIPCDARRFRMKNLSNSSDSIVKFHFKKFLNNALWRKPNISGSRIPVGLIRVLLRKEYLEERMRKIRINNWILGYPDVHMSRTRIIKNYKPCVMLEKTQVFKTDIPKVQLSYQIINLSCDTWGGEITDVRDIAIATHHSDLSSPYRSDIT